MNQSFKALSVIGLFVFAVWLTLRFQSKPVAADPGRKVRATDMDIETSEPSGPMDLDTTVALHGGIAFVKSESLASGFNLMVRKRKALQARLQKAEKEWEGEAVRFRKELEDFQRKSAAMGESQRSATEQMLARKEQNLMQMRESIMEELSKSETVVDQELRTLLDKEFELFSKARGYRFLMARQVGSGLLYGDSLVDVTEQLVSYLNTRYP